MRVRKPQLTVGLLLLAALAVGIPVLADYTGPDRVVSTFVWERKVCDYQAVYDPPGPGWYGCSLTLYESPDGRCDTNVGGYFNPTACVGWPRWLSCDDEDCDISRSESIDGCNQGQPGCRQVEQQSSLPEATISGSITCTSPGSNGWCRGGGALDLAGDEPVSGESILALEGTHNGATFACPGESCSVGLNEGSNDFTFWAISSFGDTSRMGSASGGQDSQDPSLSGSVSGTGGDNGWYVSDVTIEASADDSLSGMASLDVRINGGGWSSYGGPFSLGDGSHTVELRAVDIAGNTTSDSFSVDIDTGDPFVDLDATPSFCPGCMETAGVTINVGDGGSGIVSWKLTASGMTVASGSTGISQTISWDGSGLGGGTHSLDLDARDAAGNSASASFTIGIISPTPLPPEEDEADEGQPRVRSFAPPTATATLPELMGVEEGPDSPTALESTPAPRPTATPRTFTFGAMPASPAEDGSSSGPAPRTSPSSSGPTVPSGALYGAAALAVIAGATAVAAENVRRRREEEARKREEMARLNAEAEAIDKARAAAIAAARAEAELAQGQILSAATGGEAPSPAWLAAAAAAAAVAAREAEKLKRLWSKEEKLDPQIPPPAPAFDMAKWKQQDYAEAARYQAQQEALRREQAYQAFREQERSVGRAEPAEKPWWEKALDWVDQHQVGIAIGVGVAAGLAAVVLTGGVAAPLVIGALAAGGASALGTVGLNAHYDRPLAENVLRNVAYSSGAAVLSAGAALVVSQGLVGTAVLKAGNAVSGFCVAHPLACARVATGLTVLDKVEELTLQVQFGIQSIRGDPRAYETKLELDLEYGDGGVPGNTVIRELWDTAGDALRTLSRYGDESVALANVVATKSDDVVQVLENGIILVRPERAEDVAGELLSSLRVSEVGDVRVYYSATSGAVYSSVPTTGSLEALDRLEEVVNSGRVSGEDVDKLVEAIAAGSTRGSGDRLVLGRFAPDGFYIRESLDNGGLFYDTGGQVWARLKALEGKGLDPIRVNLAVLQQQMERGVPQIQLVDETIDEVFRLRSGSDTAAELRFLLETAESFGYRLDGETWTLVK
ncbi:MAG TPA: hypothetical protein VLL77_08140 [Anaerolineales bacterium]|nr:hypothetical protein [Anaerolineales bacterium]